MPHMHDEEFLAFERLHERERQMKQQHKFAYRGEPHMSNFQRMVGNIGGFLIALGTRMQRVEQHSEHIV
ncbi:MAG TPA: hypothetical protein VEI53_15115 [Ktedonobacteraceae bacterium]|nr:hypothetical protein [Ktedonobacteraceae bacterium]